MTDIQQEPSATIAFGASFDRPKYTARGPNAKIKADVADAVGISPEGKTLAEVLVEASLVTHDLVAKHLQGGTGATQQELPAGAAEAPDQAAAQPAEPAKPKRSGNGRRKAKAEPEVDHVAESFKGAVDLDELRTLWTAASKAGTLNKPVHEALFKSIVEQKGWVK